MCIMTEYHIRSDNMSAEIQLLITALKMSQILSHTIQTHRVTWGKAPPFGDDLSLTYLFASTSEKSYIYVTNYMLCV